MKAVAIYLRVSSFDQKKGIESQRRALKEYCNNHGFMNRVWYKDKLSGKDTNRPAFKKLQKDIFAGKVHTVIVWKLDRLSRNLRDGINVLTDWLKKDVRIIAITQDLDFTGTMGQMIANILFAIAQMERENIRENTKRGLANAKAKGIKLGRKFSLDQEQVIKAKQLKSNGSSVRVISEQLDVTRQTVYNYLKRA